MRATLIHDSPVELDAGWLRRHFAAAGTPGETLYGDQGSEAGRAAAREDLEMTSKSLFEVVKSGKVKIEISARYKLADAQSAHRDLEGRKKALAR